MLATVGIFRTFQFFWYKDVPTSFESPQPFPWYGTALLFCITHPLYKRSFVCFSFPILLDRSHRTSTVLLSRLSQPARKKISCRENKKKGEKKNKLGCGPTLAQVFVYQGTSLLELVQRLSVWPPVLYLFCDTFLEFWQLDMVWRDATKLAQTWLSFLQCSQNSTVVCTVTVTEPQGQRDIANANADSQEADAADENAEIVEVLNDVGALLGEPIFITNWIREWRNEIFWIFHLQRCVYLIKFANIVTNYVNLSPPCL